MFKIKVKLSHKSACFVQFLHNSIPECIRMTISVVIFFFFSQASSSFLPSFLTHFLLPPAFVPPTHKKGFGEYERHARGCQGGDVGQGERGQDQPGGEIRPSPLPGRTLSERKIQRKNAIWDSAADMHSEYEKKSWIFDTHTKKWHYTNNLYNITQTIGAAFVAKPIQVGGKVITLGIWVSQVPPLSPSRLPNNLEPSRCFI